MKSEDIREKYDKAATGYDSKILILEKLSGAHRLRQNLLKKARGKALDVACGTGRNFQYYPKNCQITGVDLSQGMLELAQKRATHLGLDVELIQQDVEKLDFPSQTFDTVVSSLGVCTYPHPIKALQEMSRVCKNDGKLLFLEHGRSDGLLLGRLQDFFAERYAKHSGCSMNREPMKLVQEAGMNVLSHHRSCLGILHVIEARACT